MFSHHMSYYDLSLALHEASLKKAFLSREQWDCVSHSLKSPLLKALLKLYPLPAQSQKVIARTLDYRRSQQLERERYSHFLDDDIHNTMYSGAVQRTRTYLQQYFPVGDFENLFSHLKDVVDDAFKDHVIQAELLLAEEERYLRRSYSYKNKILLTLEPKHSLEEIEDDFADYLRYLQQNYESKSTYGWEVLASLLLRLSTITEVSARTQALMAFVRGLDDARTSYHNLPGKKYVSGKNYSCQKGFEEFLLISHYDILPESEEKSSETELLAAAITQPFVRRAADEDGCRQSFSDLLYGSYLEASEYTLQCEREAFYILQPGNDPLTLKNDYLARFLNPALKKLHGARFDNIYDQLKQQIVTVSASEIAIINFLVDENALTIEYRQQQSLVCHQPAKTQEEILEHMVARGPFIDKAHLKTVLALIDPQASTKTLQTCAQLQTYPVEKIEPLTKSAMVQVYKDYLQQLPVQPVHDFLLKEADFAPEVVTPNLFLDDILSNIPAETLYDRGVFFSEDVFLQWAAQRPSIANEKAEALAVLFAEAGYSRAMDILIESYSVSPHYSADVMGVKNLIQIAAENGHTQIVRNLFEKGAAPNTKKALYGPLQLRINAMTLAAKQGYGQVVATLIDLGDDLRLPSHNISCLEAAISQGHMDIIETLLEAGVPMDQSILSYILDNAPAGLRQQILTTIVSAGLSAEQTQEVLMNAVSNADMETVNLLFSAGVFIEDFGPFVATEGPTIAMLITLVKNMCRSTSDFPKASVNAIDETGLTPLMHAVIEGDHCQVRDLIERGALINKPSKAGLTALYLAVRHDHPEIAKDLLCYKITPCYKIEALKLAINKGKNNIASLIYQHCSAELIKRHPAVESWHQNYFGLEPQVQKYPKQLVFSEPQIIQEVASESFSARCTIS